MQPPGSPIEISQLHVWGQHSRMYATRRNGVPLCSEAPHHSGVTVPTTQLISSIAVSLNIRAQRRFTSELDKLNISISILDPLAIPAPLINVP